MQRGTRWANAWRVANMGPGPRPGPISSQLLDLDAGAGFFQLRLDRVGLLLVHALLDRLRSRVDEVLGLLEAKAGDRADDLDHLDLLAAGVAEDHVEGALLLRRAAVTGCGTAACRRDRDRSGSGD